MPLEALDPDNSEAAHLAATARAVLKDHGKEGAESISQADIAEVAARAAGHLFNGDGILPDHEALPEEIREYVRNVLAVMGGVKDANGEPGVNLETSEAFVASLREWQAWRDGVEHAAGPLGADTPEAWGLLQDLQDKIDDYFLRCELASFSRQSPEELDLALGQDIARTLGGALPRDGGNAPSRLSGGLLDRRALGDLPLASVGADRPLRLDAGLNPAWRDRVVRFAALIRPLLAREDSMSRGEWEAVKAGFAPYREAVAKKPGLAAVTVTIPVSSALEDLGAARIAAILEGGVPARFAEFAAKDASSPADAASIRTLERLVHYYLHLHRLLVNFVSFYDFYSLRRRAVFQDGKLYIDGRCCSLCLPVADVEKHATLAARSELCLLYCECRRVAGDGGPEQKTTIVAAMTAGDSDLLMEGRNGVFVDNEGRDWDATVIKMVTNPISIRQALWDPYKRFGRMVAEQVGKFATSRRDAQAAAMGQQLEQAGTAAGQATVQAQPFDIGKSVGIFAAIGLALGALGTALAGIARALFSLSWWQFPLVILGLFLLISGPSVIMAWLKLRKRTLGPVLEASGWAVNGRIPINLGLGGALTDMAVLPPNSTRSYSDPFKKPRRWPWALAFALAVVIGAGAWWLWKNPVDIGSLLPKATESAPPPAAAPAAAKPGA